MQGEAQIRGKAEQSSVVRESVVHRGQDVYGASVFDSRSAIEASI